MEPTLEQTISQLERTPSVLDALLRNLPGPMAEATEGEGTWSVPEIISHLIQGEHTDWVPRARMIVESGETKAFPPFDMHAHIEHARGKSIEQLLDEFALARKQSLAELRAMNLSADELRLRGRHPALGVVTLSELLSTWATHDLTHLHQLSRVLAQPYREAVGPWSAYLGVLHCSGHGAK
jgi:hypothetical protein